MAAILDFLPTMQYLKYYSDNTTITGIPENPTIDTQKTHKYVSYHLWFDLEQMAAILGFLPTMQCRKYFLVMPLCRAYYKTL